MEITKVGVESIPAIHSLAKITWPETYREILTEAQISYMMDLIYSPASLQKQMELHAHQFLLLSIHDVAAGFASYSVKSVEEPSTYKLQKIYVSSEIQGKSLGKALLDFVITEIRTLGATKLELNVNRHNKAIGFYQKQGFTIIEEKDIPIGNGFFMNDYIMMMNLEQ